MTPDLMLHNDYTGDVVRISGGGKSSDVFDFSVARTRELFIEACINATKTGYVDGCFADRAVDGTPTDSGNDNVPSGKKYNLTDAHALAYAQGHVQVLTELQAALGDGPLIANHAYGPPHDPLKAGAVSFSMIEGFGPNNASISQLLMNAANGRGVQAHTIIQSRVDVESVLAAFLVGAGYRAYFGVGDWSEKGPDFDDHWLPQFDMPLGEPLEDGVYSSKTRAWSRRFEHVNVTFDTKKNVGHVQGWKFSAA